MKQTKYQIHYAFCVPKLPYVFSDTHLKVLFRYLLNSMKIIETFVKHNFFFFFFFCSFYNSICIFLFTQETSWLFTPVNGPMSKVIKLSIIWNSEQIRCFSGLFGRKTYIKCWLSRCSSCFLFKCGFCIFN